MATLAAYDINAFATQISREFFIEENRDSDKSYVLEDEMNLFAIDLKSRVTFISRRKKSHSRNHNNVKLNN